MMMIKPRFAFESCRVHGAHCRTRPRRRTECIDVPASAAAAPPPPPESTPLRADLNDCSVARPPEHSGRGKEGGGRRLESNLTGMEAPGARRGHHWELRWCSSDFVEEGIGLQRIWCWAPSEQHCTLRRITRGRAQLRAQSHVYELPQGPSEPQRPVEPSVFAPERQCNGAQKELPSAAEITTRDVVVERSRNTFGVSELPDINEDEELMEQGQMNDENESPASSDDDAVVPPELPDINEDEELMEQGQMNDENEPPASSDDDAVVPPLRRSIRKRKLPHIRRESSGMVDSSLNRSRFAGRAGNSSNSLEAANRMDDGDDTAGAIGMRRSGRERKLPHVRRESSGMVDSSAIQLHWSRPAWKVGNSKTSATSATAAPAEMKFLNMAKTLKQRGASD